MNIYHWRLYLNAQRIVPGRLWLIWWKKQYYTVDSTGEIRRLP